MLSPSGTKTENLRLTAAIRQAFLEYFAGRSHTVVPSSPLVPVNDPTLLFTNAGMVQFKEVFLGREQRAYTRAASSQCCVRAGGKHNDLENVGYTARHHTFFEMLGNFSFGDYFKREAIAYAWEFVTQVLQLPAEKLWVTVYHDDDEAARIWLEEIGVVPERLSRCGDKDNFWSMGPTGPCGPCTEIFYDHGPEVPGGPPGSPDSEGDRYIEIWNLVFIQYNRDENGELHPLPRPCVDTGMGLERIAAVMQGVHSNYDIDLFQSLIAAIKRLVGSVDPAHRASLNVIADHIRSSAFIIAEGVVPSNEGRGYVLRRIIRRAVRHGHKLGIDGAFFYRLVAPLVAEMGESYPVLRETSATIERVLRQEEERFADTLGHGLQLLDSVIAGLRSTVIPGHAVFKLYDTYGFPLELTADIARERGLTLDLEGFDTEMAAQRQRARAAGQFTMAAETFPVNPGVNLPPTVFTGYDGITGLTTVAALYRNGEAVDALAAGETGMVVLNETPFYAESGGQIGDTGELKGSNGIFQVDTTRKQGPVFVHSGVLKIGQLKVGEKLQARVEPRNRAATARNHSATHLLHAALRQILGKHVQQKGSLVEPERLRFDFSHPGPLAETELRAVEQLVNQEIRANHAVETRLMPVQQALESGAMALFGEKYDADVRVLRMGEFSVELCGGTHVFRTGDIGLFKIMAESGVAAGIRRIEAVTGEGALTYIEGLETIRRRLCGLLKATPESLLEKVEQLQQQFKQQEKQNLALKSKLSSQTGGDLTTKAIDIAGIKVLAVQQDGANANMLRELLDQLKNKLGTAVIVLGSVEEGKVTLVAGVTKDLTAKLKAGDLVNFVASQVGGKGGGRPDMAQAGGTNPAELPAALDSVETWVRERV